MEDGDRVVFSSTNDFARSLKGVIKHEKEESERMNIQKTEGKHASHNSNVDDGNMVEDDVMDVKEEEEDHQLDMLNDEPLASQGMAATLALLQRTGGLKPKREYDGNITTDPNVKDDRIIETGMAKKWKKDIKIEHRDAFGRLLSQHDAFRELSYKFHGVTPSTKKKEKILRKMAESESYNAHSGKGGKHHTSTMQAAFEKATASSGEAHMVIQSGGKKSMF